MNIDLSVLRDPKSGGRLTREGSRLVAADGVSYPIVDSIPRLVASANYSDDFGVQWNLFRKTQLDSHTGLDISRSRLERCFRGELGSIAGKLVLEAGSGAGRFTEVLLGAGAIVHSLDYSSAVSANASNNGASDRLTLVQADIREIPFAKGSYDYVVCLGVLQHTPSPEESMASLWSMLKPGGRLVIDHYRYRLRFRLPTPFGDAASLYRWAILRLPRRYRFRAVKRITDFWFPVHWAFRDSLLAQRLIRRVSPVRFYYPALRLADREMYYEFSLLDTHDSTTDVYKHLRSEDQIRATLRGLGAEDVTVSVGGNGVEASCRKPNGGESASIPTASKSRQF